MKNLSARRQHARKRATERHGIVLSKILRKEMVSMIRAGESVDKLRMTHTSGRRTCFKSGVS